MNDIIIFIALGALGGLIGGLIGVGGGLVFVPVLDYYFRLKGIDEAFAVKLIIANSLTLTFFTGLSATLRQISHKNFFLRESISVGVFGACSALLCTIYITTSPWFDKKKFLFFFIFVLVLLVVKMVFSKENTVVHSATANQNKGKGNFWWLIGVAAGFISALTGIGGGSVMVPFLVASAKFPLKKATSVSMAAIVIMSFTMLVYYLFKSPSESLKGVSTVGLIAYGVVLPMAIGVFLGSFVGVNLNRRLSAKTIKIVFVSFVTIVIITLILQ